LAWGSRSIVYAQEIRHIIENMRFRKLFFALDACYSGSIGEACEGVPGVLVMTAAHPYETSKADMKDENMEMWLSNGFTRAFQEAIDKNPNISLRDLYYQLARQTVGSHAMVYNYPLYGNLYANTMQEYLQE
jgi:glycosylphosphatidylinositol transamidase (GPIT) subunit GPI8